MGKIPSRRKLRLFCLVISPPDAPWPPGACSEQHDIGELRSGSGTKEGPGSSELDRALITIGASGSQHLHGVLHTRGATAQKGGEGILCLAKQVS